MDDKNYNELSYNDKFEVFSKTNILERTKDSVFVVYSEPIPNNNGKIKVKDARKLSYEDIELIGRAYGFYINENNCIYCFRKLPKHRLRFFKKRGIKFTKIV